MALGWISCPTLPGACGVRWRQGDPLKSVIAEIPLSILVAPMMMMTQTLAVIDILRGRPSGWAAQNRSSDGIAVSDAIRHYRWHIAVGVVIALAAVFGMNAAIWMSPIFAGLLFAPFMAAWTSRRSYGEKAARLRLFLIPEERRPSPLILDARPAAADHIEPDAPSGPRRWPALDGMVPRRQVS